MSMCKVIPTTVKPFEPTLGYSFTTCGQIGKYLMKCPGALQRAGLFIAIFHLIINHQPVRSNKYPVWEQ